MVHSVVAVPNVGKVKRERRSFSYSGTSGNSPAESFAQVLDRVSEDVQDSPMNCVTTTYGRDCRMRTFLYQPREYHF